MKEVMKRIKISSTYGANKMTPEQMKDMDGWRVQLRLDGRQLSFDYFKGRGHAGAEPGKTEVLNSLLSDARAGEMSFEEFCGEFGYDTDSRRAEATWKACKAMSGKLYKLLGDHVAEVEAAVQDY